MIISFPLWNQQLCCVNLMELLLCDAERAAQADDGRIKGNSTAKDYKHKNHDNVILIDVLIGNKTTVILTLEQFGHN